MQTAPEFIRQVSSGQSLTVEQAATAMNGIMKGEWTPAQVGAYLVALRMKGETVEEITGSAQSMRANAFSAQVQNRPVVDTAGSGGDGLHTINVSTLAALIAAGAGVPMAKHGNRAITGQCGSADILEGLGVTIDIPPADAVAGLDENNFTFMFAQHFHPSMRHAIGPRKEIGVPSIFNMLGPLTNPLAAEAQLIGVAVPENTRRFTEVLVGMGCQHSLVVCGADGMDEISLTGPTKVVEQKGGQVSEYTLTPEDFGMRTASVDELRVEGREKVIELGRQLLNNQAPEPHTHLVLMNAAAAIYLGGKAGSVIDALPVAKTALESGAAKQVLDKVVAYTASKKA